MKVILLQRRPAPGQFSIEGYFARVLVAFDRLGLDCCMKIAPALSRGLWPRLRILLFAARNRGEVTHITGDITFAALATHPRTTVLTVLDCEVLERMRGLKKALIKFFWFTLPTRRAAAVTVISEATKAQVLHHVPGLSPQKVHVVPVSVSDAFLPTPPRPMPDRPRILQVGTKANKNVSRLVRALQGRPCRLVLVGDPPPDLVRQMSECSLEHEVHIGVSEAALVELYQAADIVSFVSTYEGFGMPIVEAQSVGRPVITSNCSSMPEVAGAGACLVDPYDDIQGELECAWCKI